MGNTATSICNRLGVILGDSLTKQLCFWLKHQLEQYGGKNWWKHNVVKVLTDGLTRDFERGCFKVLEDFDLYGLLKIFRANYLFLKTPCSLAKNTDLLIERMVKVRNLCAGHRPANDHTPEELERWIVTTINFSKLINVHVDTLSELASLKYSSQGSLKSDETIIHRRINVNPIELKSCYRGIHLTPSQDRCLDSLADFLRNRDSRSFILNGYAGTGKTFLLGGLVRYLTNMHMIPVLLAPTGRAAQVMQNAHQIKASTIHRYIYALNDIREYSEISEDGDITFKFYYGTRPNELNNDAIFIVDESSMVSDVLTEDEFMHFGSGRLLTDLLDHINFDANDYLKKVIFVGDSAQIPPVGMSESPALSREYLLNECMMLSEGFQLTDVVRQESDSAILQNATSIRTLLDSGVYSHFNFISNDSEVSEVEQSAFVPMYYSDSGDQPDISTIIITKTRNLAASYNKTIRQHYFPHGDLLMPNDLIMIQKNNYAHCIDLFNGQTGKIIKVSPGQICHEVFMNMGRDEDGESRTEKIRLSFRRALIEFYDVERQIHNVDCFYLENDLYDVENQHNESALSKALYVDFRERNKQFKPNTEEFKRALRSDKYFNAIRMKHAYAVTAHKSQGGEWPRVYVDFSGSNKLNTDALRWSYTAITRARIKLVATNALHSTLIPEITASPIDIVNQANITIETQTLGIDLQAVPENVKTQGLLAINLYILIINAIGDDIEVTSCRTHDFQITVTVSGTTVIRVYYNSKCVISRIILDSAPNEYRDKLYALRGKCLIELADIDIASESNMTPAMRTVYESMKKTFDSLEYKCGIESIPTEYLMRIRVSRMPEWVSIDCQFDKRGTCNKVTIGSSSTESFKLEMKKAMSSAWSEM